MAGEYVLPPMGAPLVGEEELADVITALSTACVQGPELRQLAAQVAIRQLDELAYPWGEPGVVPTEPGEYWLSVPGKALSPVYSLPCANKPGLSWFYADGIHVGMGGQHLLDMAKAWEWQYRRRWTPEGPVTP